MHSLELGSMVGKFAFDSHFVPVSHLANIEGAEILDEVLEGHPKGAVISKDWFDFSDCLFSPALAIFVAPSSFPFKGTPRIPNVQQLMTFKLDCLYD
jgi:hypothetical protein